MENFIPIYEPELSGNEKKYVIECLDSSWISSKGKFITEFEKKFEEYLGSGYSSTCSNGTVALHLALLALGIKADDEILVPSFTYVASVNAITFCNARPVFLDSDPANLQIDLQDLERKIRPNSKAIIVPHLYGMMVDMEKICKIARANNLFIVEDCAESFGSTFKGQHSGTFGDIATFSFFGNKTITTGEGGMVHSTDQNLIHKVNHLKAQGLASLNQLSDNKKEYWHDVVGYNYRMTNIQAAIGLAQIERADNIVKKKQKIADLYFENIDKSVATLLRPTEDVVSSYWMVTVLFKNEDIRDRVRLELSKKNVETRPIFPMVHTMPMYENLGQGPFPQAENFCSCGINLPSSPKLTEKEIILISEIINRYAK